MERKERELNEGAARGEQDPNRMAGVTHDPDRDRGLSGGLALGTTLLVAGLAVSFLAFGCGKEESRTVATTAGASGPSTPARNASIATPAAATPAAGVAETTPGESGTSVQGLQMGTVSGDALPPEVEVSVAAGESVAPGSIVELKADGSADVVAMTLRDARGKEEPFTYDEAAGVWRALYRAPIKAGGDRLALSVTAKNGAERWRRVWVFLNVGQAAATPPDSTSR